MFKHALLAFTFVAVLGAAGLGVSSKAVAWSDCHSGVRYGVAYPTYAVGYAGYYPYVGYTPRVAYYPPVPVRSYPVYYGRDKHHRHHHYHHNHHNGLSVSFGF